MTELEKQIIEWHRKTFPRATVLAITNKLTEELREAIDCINDGDIQHILEEIADVFIVGCALAANKKIFEDNVTMSRVIADKLEINKARTWGPEIANGDRPRVK